MKLQKWLLPSKSNRFHPYLLRPFGLGVIIALLLSINISQNLTEAHQFQVLGVATNISASDVISISNQQRANNGLSSLAYNAKLASAAEAKARDMFAKDYWAHYAPDGTSPWYFITSAGYTYKTAGENLAKGFDTSAGVVDGWMNSPGHRANILNTTYRDTGIAVMNGTLQGEQTTLVVAMYGSTSAAATTPAPTTPRPTSTPTPKKTAVASPVVNEAPAAPATPTTVPTPAPAPVTVTPKQEAPKTTTPVAAANTTPRTRVLDERSVSARESRTWAQNSTLFLLCTLFLVSVFKHTVVWRTKKRGWRHIWLRSHPMAQYALLFVAIVANLTSGVGVIR